MTPGHPDSVVVGYDHLHPLDEPEPCLQTLWAAGCTRVFLDVVPRHRSARPALDQALGQLQAGDILVVRKLIRGALSLGHLLEVLAAVASHGAGFRSLQDGLDTTVPGGELLQVVVGGLIEAKQAWTSESTREGLDAARERGSRVGRQPTLTPSRQPSPIDCTPVGSVRPPRSPRCWASAGAPCIAISSSGRILPSTGEDSPP